MSEQRISFFEFIKEKKEKRSTPIHAEFWMIKEEDKDLEVTKIASRFHNTKNSFSYSFYKPIHCPFQLNAKCHE